MTEQEKQNNFRAALKAAILESLTERWLITKAEKATFEQENLSSN